MERPEGRAEGGVGGRCSPAIAWTLGLLLAALYLLLATPRIRVQGLHYDELHQGAAAFAYAPGSGTWSAAYTLFGLPALNMPYSGAVKSAIYGEWLRWSGRPFTVASWRLLGCVFTAAGIALAGAAFARWVSGLGAVVLGLLLATDVTVILATRHDWGPVALALFLRMALLAVWLRAWARESASRADSFGLGFLLGFAVFEKLSSVVLLLPVGAAFVLDRRRRCLRHIAWGVLGGLAGSLPLAAVNLDSWMAAHSLVSLSGGVVHAPDLPPLWDFLGGYYGLGAGTALSGWILGDDTPPWTAPAEAVLVGLLGLVLLVASLLTRPCGRFLRAAAVFAALHALVGLAVVALPAFTWVHHWVLGTPLQYVAFALAATALAVGEGRATASGRLSAWGFAPLVALLLLLRVATVIPLEASLYAGHSSPGWDPSYTRLAEFAARQTSGAAFVAGEWGLANQVICVSNGRVPVPEPYWGYRDEHDLRLVVEGAPAFYLLAQKPISDHPGQARRMLADARALEAFREVPVEAEVAELRAVQAWKFVRAPDGGAAQR